MTFCSDPALAADRSRIASKPAPKPSRLPKPPATTVQTRAAAAAAAATAAATAAAAAEEEMLQKQKPRRRSTRLSSASHTAMQQPAAAPPKRATRKPPVPVLSRRKSRAPKAPTWDSMYAAERAKLAPAPAPAAKPPTPPPPPPPKLPTPARQASIGASPLVSIGASPLVTIDPSRRVSSARKSVSPAAFGTRASPAASLASLRTPEELDCLSNARATCGATGVPSFVSQNSMRTPLFSASPRSNKRAMHRFSLYAGARASIFGEPDGASPASYSDGGQENTPTMRSPPKSAAAHRAKALYSAAKASSVMKGSAARVSIGSGRSSTSSMHTPELMQALG